MRMRTGIPNVKRVIERLRLSIELEQGAELQFPLGIFQLIREEELAEVEAALTADGHTFRYHERQPGFLGTGYMIVTKNGGKDGKSSSQTTGQPATE